jgi:hypothetical protein
VRIGEKKEVKREGSGGEKKKRKTHTVIVMKHLQKKRTFPECDV